MSGSGERDTEVARDCLDIQLSLALQKTGGDEARAHKPFSVPIPRGSALERGVGKAGTAFSGSAGFKKAMKICANIEKNEDR